MERAWTRPTGPTSARRDRSEHRHSGRHCFRPTNRPVRPSRPRHGRSRRHRERYTPQAELRRIPPARFPPHGTASPRPIIGREPAALPIQERSIVLLTRGRFCPVRGLRLPALRSRCSARPLPNRRNGWVPALSGRRSRERAPGMWKRKTWKTAAWQRSAPGVRMMTRRPIPPRRRAILRRPARPAKRNPARCCSKGSGS